MKRIGLLLLYVLGITIVHAQDVGLRWAVSSGDIDDDKGLSVAVDNQGNVYTTGHYEGDVDFNPGAGVDILSSVGGFDDMYIQKLNRNGEYEWAKTIGGYVHVDTVNGSIISRIGAEKGHAIEVDAYGNIYVAGVFYYKVDFNPNADTNEITSNGMSDVFVMKLDSNGNFIWAKGFGGIEEDILSSIDVDLSGNVYLTGSFKDTVDFDPGNGVTEIISNGAEDVFILKLDINGEFIWVNRIGGTQSDSGYDIEVSPSGEVYVCGKFKGSVDLDPGQGTNIVNTNYYGDVFLLKLDVNANYEWVNTGVGFVSGASIDIDHMGNTYMCGYFIGNGYNFGTGSTNITSNGNYYDFFIRKIDVNGNSSWGNAYGGTSHDFAYSIAVDHEGSVYTTGSYRDTVDFDPGIDSFITEAYSSDAFIQKLDSNGVFQWVVNFEGNNYISDAYGYSIKTDDSKNVYVSGYFDTAVDFDPSSESARHFILTSNGAYDIFTAKLGECSTIVDSVDLTVCNYFLDPSWNSYNYSTDTISYTLSSSSGCDSIVYLDLTVNRSSTSPKTDTILTCDSAYTWVDGNTYTFGTGNSSVQIPSLTIHQYHNHSYTNSVGCDSIVSMFLVMFEAGIAGIATTSTGQPILNSKVLLIEFDPADSSLTAIDSTTTSNSFMIVDTPGIFVFPFYDAANLYVKVIPDSTAYPGEFPTYFHSSITWQDASQVNCFSSFSSIAGVNPGGNGFIGGYVNQGAGKSGNAAAGVTVVLVNSDGEVVAMTTTDANGYFSFDDIPEDDAYSIWVDQPGIDNNIAPEIALTNNQPEQDSLQFLLHPTYLELLNEEDSTNVGITELNQLDFRVYPNPTSNSFNIELSSLDADYTVEIYDVLGKLVYNREVNKQNISISTENWSAGLYNIRLRDKSGTSIGFKKIVVARY